MVPWVSSPHRVGLGLHPVLFPGVYLLCGHWCYRVVLYHLGKNSMSQAKVWDQYYDFGPRLTLAGYSVTRFGVFCTLGNHSKLVTTNILPKSPTLLANFCIGVKIIHFSSEFIFEIFYRLLAIFIWSHWKWVLSNFSYNRPPWHQNLRTFYDIQLLGNSYI